MPDFVIDNPTSVQFEVSQETRTIRGLALPFGDVAESGGKRWSFSKGTLTLGKTKVLDGHDWGKAVGTAELSETDEGILMVAKIARGARGDEVLALAEDGVYDGLSVGLGNDVKATVKGGVNHASSGTIREVSLTPLPAFARAAVTSVAASAVQTNQEHNMPENETAEVETPVSFSAADLTEAVKSGVSAAFDAFRDAPAQPVAAGRPVAFQVNEPAPYRFDGVQGAHDFSTDLISGLGLGARSVAPDPDAYERVLRFMGDALGPQFVTTTDTTAINPTGYRADMFVNEQQFATPLYNAFYKGALTDVTPFTFSKFNTSTGLVADHVQGTEPTAGTYTTATAATVTPAPVSGKVHITREVADQGGNPQVSALIWSKIQYEYRKAMETKVAAMLGAASPTEFSAALAVGASTVANLAAPIEAAIAGLNFIAGGNRYRYTAAHIDLYKAMAALKDGQSRPYFPIINPQNANGTTAVGYSSLNVAGTRFDPVWSLGTVTDGTPHKSYLADPSAIWFWATAPQRLDRLQEKVEGYDLGVWGYWAGVISDITGLLKITYDPS